MRRLAMYAVGAALALALAGGAVYDLSRDEPATRAATPAGGVFGDGMSGRDIAREARGLEDERRMEQRREQRAR